ncbi:MAG: hypothetical protein K6F69_00150, partial [Treponema sp.]|nr:hypothetical protein [Treponema sp.]
MLIISKEDLKNNFDYVMNQNYLEEIFIKDNNKIKVLSNLETYNSLRENAGKKKISIEEQANNSFINEQQFEQKENQISNKLNILFNSLSCQGIDTEPLKKCCSILLNNKKKSIENYIKKTYLKDIAIAMSFFNKEEQKIFLLLNFTENEHNEILKYIDIVQDENDTDYTNLINRVYKSSNEYNEDFIKKII